MRDLFLKLFGILKLRNEIAELQDENARLEADRDRLIAVSKQLDQAVADLAEKLYGPENLKNVLHKIRTRAGQLDN